MVLQGCDYTYIRDRFPKVGEIDALAVIHRAMEPLAKSGLADIKIAVIGHFLSGWLMRGKSPRRITSINPNLVREANNES